MATRLPVESLCGSPPSVSLDRIVGHPEHSGASARRTEKRRHTQQL
jgi:hypothetical protein